MKVIYEFGEEDLDNRKFFEFGESFWRALHDIDRYCRDKLKYEQNISEQTSDVLQDIRDMMPAAYFEIE